MPNAPIAQRQEHTATYHGFQLRDHYHWLKDQSYPIVDDPNILSYLQAENVHYERVMAPLAQQVETLFKEFKGRQVEDESSVPAQDGPFVYQTRFVPDQQYPVHVRWPKGDQSWLEHLVPNEKLVQVVLDENALAEDTPYFRRRGFSIDPTHRLLAYGVDLTGAERFTLHLLDIATGELYPETMANATGNVIWSTDSTTLFYVINNENWRPFRVMRHILGTDPSDDEIIYEERDDGFFVNISQTTSERYLVISTASNVTSEVRILPLANPLSELTVIAHRRDQHEYDVDHHRDRFVIRTNDQHENFRLAVAPEETPTIDMWQPLLESSDTRYVTSMLSFESHVAVAARENGLEQVLILSDDEPYSIPFTEPVYSLGFSTNLETDPPFLRIEYSSLTTPETTFDYEFSTRTLHTRKVQQIPSGHDPNEYRSERKFATARDGARIPISLVYQKNTPLDGSAPLYLYAYGAYGLTSDPAFRTNVLSLLDRGFVYAIAHIRGGAEMGHHWYEAGKLKQRTNTFNDFVDVAHFLIESKYTSKQRLAISGGSAGGSLMGAVINQAPHLWGVVAAHVPFVDILNTMLDDSLPLTPIEWPEWGNPIESKEDYEYIRSYSPYDQLTRIAYPPLFVTAGLNDPRVTYWEPAKWVAKIRHLKTDKNPLVLKTEMSAGHGGKSGRFDALREVAQEYAFILNALNKLD